MANHPSAEKRNRQRIKRTLRNRAIKSTVRTLVKNVRTEVAGKNKEGAEKALKLAISELDRAGTKGAYHKKTVARTISRLAASVAKLGKG